MKILVFSTHDIRGGAGENAYMISKGLISKGHEVLLYVKKKETDEKWIIESKTNRHIKLILHMLERVFTVIGEMFSKPFPFTPGIFGENINPILHEFKPDIILFGWTWKGFVSFKTILKTSEKYKVFLRMADWSPFSNGIYFPYVDFITLDLDKLHYMHRLLIGIVKKYRDTLWNKHSGDFTMITPSRYLKKQVVNQIGNKYNIEVISNGIDVNIFKPYKKSEIKEELNLNNKKTHIIFGAGNYFNDSAKGGELIIEITKKLVRKLDPKKIAFITFGQDHMEEYLPHLKDFEVIHFGYIKEKELIGKLFAAADLALLTSKQESFSLVTLQYLICRTPVVAFNVGAISELITDGENGYMVNPFDIDVYVQKVMQSLDSKLEFDLNRDYSYERMRKEYIDLLVKGAK